MNESLHLLDYGFLHPLSQLAASSRSFSRPTPTADEMVWSTSQSAERSLKMDAPR